MAVLEVFADGIGSVRIVGETVRLDLVSLDGGEGSGFQTRVRLVLPASSLGAVIETLRRAEQGLAARPPVAAAGGGRAP